MLKLVTFKSIAMVEADQILPLKLANVKVKSKLSFQNKLKATWVVTSARKNYKNLSKMLMLRLTVDSKRSLTNTRTEIMLASVKSVLKYSDS